MPRSFVHRAIIDAARDELDPSRIAVATDAERRELLLRSRDHGVQGLVARSVRRLGALEPWALPFVENAIAIRRSHAQHVRTLRTAALALGEHDVPRLLMKGASLVDRYYHDDSLRAYGDVDMLVPSQRFADALSILEEDRFSIIDRNWHMLRRDVRGQLHLRSPDGHDMLELHWHPINPSRVRHTLSMAAADLWSDASQTQVAGADVWVPRTSRELAHLCLHAALHGCDRLIWLVDIHKVMDSPDLDLDDLQRTARHWGFGAGTYLVLALVDRWLGLSQPLQDLSGLHPGRATLAAFHRLVDRWDLGRPARDARFRQLLFATAADGVGRRARLTWSLVVPPDIRNPEAGREPLGPLLSRMTDRRGDEGPAQARRARRGRCRAGIPAARGPCPRTRPVPGARRIRTIGARDPLRSRRQLPRSTLGARHLTVVVRAVRIEVEAHRCLCAPPAAVALHPAIPGQSFPS